MKILFAIKRLENSSGGAERVLAHLTGALARRGHEVGVMTWDAPGARPFYEFDPAVTLINRGVGDSGRPTQPAELVARIGDLRGAVRARGPDVAVGFGHPMFVPLALALARSGIPVVASEHAARAHYAARPADYALFRIAARLSRSVTVTSEAVRADYTADVRRRMVVMPNPIMIEAPVPPRRSGRLLLSIGRLDPQKDQATLIRAFARIAPRFPDWRLRILGEGHLRRELEALVSETGLGDRIVLPGITRDVLGAYAEADAFVLSSSYESFGLVTMEAMAQRLPVVGFADCPGTNELIIDGETGLLVRPGADRIVALANGMAQLMQDEALRRRMGEAGHLRAAALVARDDAVDRWEALLRPISGTEARPCAA
ncbi:glycosyltransferase family 4 protein [Brevundimonas sp.]|uniref:glycosyltransferase family 4 protein n=1 Tax=Brevundimonas sp. TaxID=1871086 RepID=UPI00286CC048|nr:glycosyltransferase family 4 protein [Brevundimonas sp.]